MAYRLNMANANVRRHLSELEMWRTEGMVEQGVTHVQIVDAFGVHQTVITKPWSRFSSTVHQSDGIVMAEKGIRPHLKTRFC